MALYLLGITRSRDFSQLADQSVSWVFAEKLAGVVLGPRAAPPEPDVHVRVLTAIHSRTDVLPVRLGIAAPDEETMRVMLLTNARELTAALDRLKGACEMGLRILFSHKQPHFSDNVTAAVSPADYLSLRRARYDWEDALNQEADSVVSRYLEAVQGLCRQWQRLTPAPPGLVRLALLVDRQCSAALRHRLEATHATHQAEHYMLLGPWPPYSFV